MLIPIVYLLFVSSVCGVQLFDKGIGTDDLNLLVNGSKSLHRFIKEAQQKSKSKNNLLEGFAAAQMKQLEFYMRAGNTQWVDTVCETGFNGGHSSLALLFGSTKSKLISFDLFNKPFQGQVLLSFQDTFGRDRVDMNNFVGGDSTVSLPKYIELRSSSVKCNIISIDGGHSFDVAYSDLINLRKIASCDHILLMDDIFQKYADVWNVHHVDGAKYAWIKAIKEKLIEQLGCYEYYEEQEDIWRDEGVWDAKKRLPRAFCVGTYTDLSNCKDSKNKAGRKRIKDIMKKMSLPSCPSSACN
jgi:hypothetical protein